MIHLRLYVFVFLGVVPDVNIVPVNISYEKVKTKSSDVGTGLAFFAERFHWLAEEYINADDVIAFCLYLLNELRRNLIEIRSCAILSSLPVT